MEPAPTRRLALDVSRRSSDRIVAGVAGGIADRLGTSASYVRAAFLVTAVLWGLGVVLYIALWMASFDNVQDQDRRPLEGPRQLGLGLIFMGGILAFRGIGWWPGDTVVVMTAALAFGLAVLGEYDWVARVFDPDRARPSKLRVVIGGIMLLVGLVVLGNAISQVPTFSAVAVAAIITGVGVGLVFGPWLVALGRQLGDERGERIRQEERAELAAHLHDSVLQTLALMQRTDDPKRMVTLARQQERELRAWLFDPSQMSDGTRLAAAVSEAGARVEADFTVPVEVVTVGDAAVGDVTRSLVAAATEAMVNAAKHSGADEVSVYLEVADGRADVWVADLGAGFVPSQVPGDRRGLSESIVRRMERVGGGASVDTRPGEGTEVHLWAPVSVPALAEEAPA